MFVPFFFLLVKLFLVLSDWLSFLRSEPEVPHVCGAGPGTPVYLIKLTWFEFHSFQQLLALTDWKPSAVL